MEDLFKDGFQVAKEVITFLFVQDMVVVFNGGRYVGPLSQILPRMVP